MQTVTIGKSSLSCSRLAYGCWRVLGTSKAEEITPEREETARRAIRTAYESGYTLFDHADVYCQGEAERVFGDVLAEDPGMRDRILLATKCGIRAQGEPWSDSPHRYDFSAEHIVKSCENSLRRLRTDTIDIFQLHRPDYLCNPEEVATAFSDLIRAGKVREVGVSNFRPSLLAALQKACHFPLIVHQVEISLAYLAPFDDGIIDQCLTEKMTPMAWSPTSGGILSSPERAAASLAARRSVSSHLQETIQAVAEARGVSRMVVALAWLLKHPSGILPIMGTTDPDRIRDAANAADTVELTRDEWYRLFVAARGEKLP